MKNLFILALFVGLLASCTPEYIAKDPVDGTPMIIRDRLGVIEDAKRLKVDSICVVSYSNRDNQFHTIDWMNKNTTVYWSDTLANGTAVAGAHTYRVIHIQNILER